MAQVPVLERLKADAAEQVPGQAIKQTNSPRAGAADTTALAVLIINPNRLATQVESSGFVRRLK